MAYDELDDMNIQWCKHLHLTNSQWLNKNRLYCLVRWHTMGVPLISSPHSFSFLSLLPCLFSSIIILGPSPLFLSLLSLFPFNLYPHNTHTHTHKVMQCTLYFQDITKSTLKLYNHKFFLHSTYKFAKFILQNAVC